MGFAVRFICIDLRDYFSDTCTPVVKVVGVYINKTSIARGSMFIIHTTCLHSVASVYNICSLISRKQRCQNHSGKKALNTPKSFQDKQLGRHVWLLACK